MRLEPRDDWVYWVLLAHHATMGTRRRFWEERPDDLRAFLHERPEWAEALEPRLVQEAMRLDALIKQGSSLITLADPEYPESLRSAKTIRPPIVLYALGDIAILAQSPFVAFAGSRNPSERAIQEAKRLAAELVDEGYHTVSGFAKGVDQSVVRTTLEHGGKTIGVLAQGLLHRLTQQAARAYMHALNDEQLLLLSELHPDTAWSSRFAMMRNRIIAALAEFVIIVESGPKETQRDGKKVLSGTYQCAEVAHKIGRPVYVLNLPAEGNRQLLQQGIARLWEDADRVSAADEPPTTPDPQPQLPLGIE